jgi:ComF family protein
MRALWSAMLDLFLPRACARCGAAVAGERALCARCAAALPRLPSGGCRLCQSASVAADERCPACEAERGPLAQVAAEVAFAGEAAEWIRRFKYPAAGLAGLDARPAALAAALLADAARRLAGPEVGLVVPVPIHARRLRERGFHPAGELSRALARSLGVPADPRALAQLRATASQTGLDRRARRRNVRGAFAARAGLRVPRCVALVDDVVTTGATLAEAARALRRAGARRVVAVCVARTL